MNIWEQAESLTRDVGKGEKFDSGLLASTFAKLAPSVHNIQPWEIKYKKNRLVIGLSPVRNLEYGDPTGRQSWISLGACAQNAIAALEACGYEPKLSIAKNDIVIRWDQPKDNSVKLPLLRAILDRRSNRFTLSPIRNKAVLKNLKSPASIGSSRVVLCNDPNVIKSVADYSSRSIAMAMSRPELARELSSLLLNDYSKQSYGLPAKSLGYTSPQLLLQKFRLNRAAAGDSEKSREYKMLVDAPMLAFVFSQGDVQKNWVDSGRTYEAFALKLTGLGLAYSTHAACVEAPDFHKQISDLLGQKGRLHAVMRVGEPTVELLRVPRLD